MYRSLWVCPSFLVYRGIIWWDDTLLYIFSYQKSMYLLMTRFNHYLLLQGKFSHSRLYETFFWLPFTCSWFHHPPPTPDITKWTVHVRKRNGVVWVTESENRTRHRDLRLDIHEVVIGERATEDQPKPVILRHQPLTSRPSPSRLGRRETEGGGPGRNRRQEITSRTNHYERRDLRSLARKRKSDSSLSEGRLHNVVGKNEGI